MVAMTALMVGSTAAASATGVATAGLIGSAGAVTAGGLISTGFSLFTGLSGIASAGAAGDAEQAAAQNRAILLESQGKQKQQIAGQEVASSQREAYNTRKAGRLAQSKRQANVGGGGGTTIEEREGELAQDIDYAAAADLFGGEASAQSLETGASFDRFSAAESLRAGRESKRAARAKQFQVATKTGFKLLSRFGDT
jgi:hypothetical protein